MECKENVTIICQCSRCGDFLFIDKNKVKRIRDHIYRDLYCPQCKCVTAHLDVGEEFVDYALVDTFLDNRYFDYSKKERT